MAHYRVKVSITTKFLKILRTFLLRSIQNDLAREKRRKQLNCVDGTYDEKRLDVVT